MSEEYDDDLLAVAGLHRPTASKKRVRKASEAMSEEDLSADEDGLVDRPARSGRKAALGSKKRRVATPRQAEQVCESVFPLVAVGLLAYAK